jgi:hypothetical protein
MLTFEQENRIREILDNQENAYKEVRDLLPEIVEDLACLSIQKEILMRALSKAVQCRVQPKDSETLAERNQRVFAYMEAHITEAKMELQGASY